MTPDGGNGDGSGSGTGVAETAVVEDSRRIQSVRRADMNFIIVTMIVCSDFEDYDGDDGRRTGHQLRAEEGI